MVRAEPPAGASQNRGRQTPSSSPVRCARARDTPQRRGRSACRSSRRSPRAWPTHGRAGDPPWCEGLRQGGSVRWIRIREGSGCRCPRAALRAACFAGAFCSAAFPAALSRRRFVQTQTTQDVITVRVSAQRGQGIQAAQQSRGRCGAFQVLNRRQGFLKTLDAAFQVRSTRKVRILERYLRVHLGLSGWAATGNFYPGRTHAVGRRVRIARAETQRRHQSVNVTGAGSGVPRRSTRGRVTGSCGGGFICWRFVQTQTTQDVITVRVSAQRGQGIQAAQQSRGRCGAFQVLNRRQGFLKTLDATFQVRSTRKVRILERYLRVHLGLSGWAATGNFYPGRTHAVGRRVRIARAETQRRHQSVNVTGAGSGVPRRSTRGRVKRRPPCSRPPPAAAGSGPPRPAGWRCGRPTTRRDSPAARR